MNQKALTVRLPEDLFKALGYAAVDTGKSKNLIVLEAIERHPDVANVLKKQGRE